jgi:hypothetical protein
LESVVIPRTCGNLTVDNIMPATTGTTRKLQEAHVAEFQPPEPPRALFRDVKRAYDAWVKRQELKNKLKIKYIDKC